MLRVFTRCLDAALADSVELELMLDLFTNISAELEDDKSLIEDE